jgi:hypothetical protein
MSWKKEVDELKKREKLAEEIIDPRDTRRYLSEFVNLTSKLIKSGKSKFGLRP